jgi:hypothetical protein
MWSTFEKFKELKDNITQIASDVLDQQDLDGVSLDGSEGHYSTTNGHSQFSHPQYDLETHLPSELEYQGDRDYCSQSDMEAASANYAAILKEKEEEVLILREENEVLKAQLLMISTRQAAILSNDENNKTDQNIQEDDQIFKGQAMDKESATLPATEQSKDEEAMVVTTETDLEGTSEHDNAAFDESDTLKTGSQGVKGTQELSAPLLLDANNSEYGEDKPACNGISEEHLHTSNAEAEQVMLLTEKLKTLEEACLLHTEEFEKRLEEALLKVEEVSVERDKARLNLGRLRQNLLDMEASTAEKMESDGLLISNLESRLQTNERSVMQLQQALSKALEELAAANKSNASLSKYTNEEMELLKQKLETCLVALESKDMELSNLQSALGQYYAESDAQERLELELREVRESNARLTEDLRIANATIDLKVQDMDIVVKKLMNAELRKQELEQIIRKLEEDVLQLRSALEQSITSLNRMSSDSDFYVDRRIVIKLLVTYIQRHHSREVLDLMVRMLGFTEDDKKRVGLAQQSARGGMVRGLFNIPSRFIGTSTISEDSESLPPPASVENESFADLWINFLLKESKERERREREEGGGKAANPHLISLTTRSTPSSPVGGHQRSRSSDFSGYISTSPLPPKPYRVPSTSDLMLNSSGGSRNDANNDFQSSIGQSPTSSDERASQV